MDFIPLVTLYITNYNYQSYLSESIESALCQDYPNLEILVFDDGSTDGSKDILAKYSDNKNLGIIYNKNKGLISTANEALHTAKGKYLIRLDADDCLEANAVSQLVEVLERNEKAVAVFPGYFLTDAAGKVIGAEDRGDVERRLERHEKEPHGACMLIKTEILKAVGGYNNNAQCQDGYDFWLKVREIYPVISLPNKLFYYRQHEGSLSQNYDNILKARVLHKQNVVGSPI